MSALYPELPHGAGLICLSQSYFETFRNDSMKRYMKMAEAMTMEASALLKLIRAGIEDMTCG